MSELDLRLSKFEGSSYDDELFWWSIILFLTPIRIYRYKFKVYSLTLQITLDVYPISVYSQLAFTLLMPPACLYLSHKVVIMLGEWVSESVIRLNYLDA